MKREVDVPKVIISALFIITAVVVLSYIFFGPTDYTNEYLERILNGEIKNPVLAIMNSLSNNSETTAPGEGVANVSVNDTIAFFSSLQDKLANQSEENLSALIKESITYALIYLKAYNLHNPPLSSDTPRIQFLIDETYYNSEIIEGEIYTRDGQAAMPDITIATSQDEILKMTASSGYIQKSIMSGNSEITTNTDTATLYFKGYLELDLPF